MFDEKKLSELNIQLPKAPDPVGAYVAFKVVNKFLYISLIFTLTLARTELDNFNDIESMDIDDIFKSDSLKVKQVPKNTIDEETNSNKLDLDDLEIEDIDIETYGKYEEFLNRYYDDNFLDLNKPNIKSRTIFINTIIGTTIPAGSNLSNARFTGSNFTNGANIAFSMSSPINFHLSKFVFNLAPELGISSLTPVYDYVKPYYLYNIIAFFRSDISKKIGIGLGPGFSYASSGAHGEDNSGIAISLFVDLVYKFMYKK